MADLTEAEYSQLCTAANDYIFAGFNTPAACKFFAAEIAADILRGSDPSETEFQANCQSFYDQCLTGPGLIMSGSVVTCPNRGGQCTATVNDYEACMTAQRQASEGWFDESAECSALTLADLSTQRPAAPQPAACLMFYLSCPGG